MTDTNPLAAIEDLPDNMPWAQAREILAKREEDLEAEVAAHMAAHPVRRVNLQPIVTLVTKAAAGLAELEGQKSIDPKRLFWLADNLHTASGKLLEAADKLTAGESA